MKYTFNIKKSENSQRVMNKRREWTLRMKRERDDRLKKKTENSREIVESIKC